MRNNNYDTKANGVAIAATYYHDTDAAIILFDENFKILQHSHHNTTAVCYYIDNGNVDAPDTIEWKLTGTDEDVIQYGMRLLHEEEDEIRGRDIQEVREAILEECSPNLIDYAIEGSAWDHINDFGSSSLSIEPVKPLIILQTTGYSQGDYAKVIYCPDDLEKAWGTEPKQSEIQKIVNRLYWDAPVYASIELNGENVPEWDDNTAGEYVLYDMPDYDEYDFDRDKFLAWVSEASGVSIEELGEVFPTEPDYI